ncbi:MAG: FAD-dependent monooxygenase [Planctomycetes bacterium]|nr:FAD-dependent monooxygenase [Planctomycetota bacterium]
MSDAPQFTIVGSGLAGALLACYLGKAGKRVDLYEKRSDPRRHGAESGRSINLALSVRGIKALEEVGLADRVLQNAIPMRGRIIHSPTGQQTFQRYGKDESQAINSVSRAGLNLILIEAAARYPNVRMYFESRCTGVDLKDMAVEVVEEVGVCNQEADTPRSPRHIQFETLVGADGAYSAVRAALEKQERFNFQQDYLSHGYKELTILPGQGGTFCMEKNALHIWPRHSFMMIALPNIDGSFTCTLFWACEGPNSFAAIQSEADLLRFFKEQFADAMPLLPNLAEEYFHNPVGPLVTMRCSPWHFEDRIVLLGDAAHAVVPFLGQGMNAAFEDCTVLARCLEKQQTEAAFQDYERLRKEHADALADMAIDNFLEMRDRVASRWFLIRKKASLLLYKLFPVWYVPLYNLIQFTTTPYADARGRARKQDRMVWRVGIGVLLVLTGLFVWLSAFR